MTQVKQIGENTLNNLSFDNRKQFDINAIYQISSRSHLNERSRFKRKFSP